MFKRDGKGGFFVSSILRISFATEYPTRKHSFLKVCSTWEIQKLVLQFGGKLGII